MRIAVLTWSDRAAGGVESYLEHVLPGLAATDDVSLWSETSEPRSRAPLGLPAGVQAMRLPADPADAAERLRLWSPDVVMLNVLQNHVREAVLASVAPSVFVAHNHHGTCISGTKAWARPVPRPCTRRFGWPCLAHYYPHRCGGISPVTMLRLFRSGQTRLATLRRCRRVVTLSSYMRDEYVSHGIDPACVVVVPYGPPEPEHVPSRTPGDTARLTLAYVGRLEPIKGLGTLIEALPAVAEALQIPVLLVVIGDGAHRSAFEAQATAVGHRPDVRVEFTGWLAPRERDRRLASADVFVMPSTWPEPFGIAGLEAAHLGVPGVAFDVGGVRDWLRDGQTGVVADADPPSPGSLARAIISTCVDPSRRAALGLRAQLLARDRTPRQHANSLRVVLTEAAVAPARVRPS